MNKHKFIKLVTTALLIMAVLSIGTYGPAGTRQKPLVHLIPCPNAEDEPVDSSDAI